LGIVVPEILGHSNFYGGKYLPFPLTVGKKWDVEFNSRPRASRRDPTYSGETKVVGKEDVSTPAGKFSAFKIVRELRSSAGGDSTFTYYYSPEVKSVVRMRYAFPTDSRDIELIKFVSGQ
jgi:hypothetical protein